MAAKYSSFCNVNASLNQVTALFRDPAFYYSLKLSLLSESLIQGGICFNLQNDVTFYSWGESISVNIVSLGAQGVRIDAFSKCDMPTQIFDWGKNRNNVEDIFNYVFANIGRYIAMYPEGGGTTIKKFCTGCGALLEGAGAFCAKCGKKQ